MDSNIHSINDPSHTSVRVHHVDAGMAITFKRFARGTIEQRRLLASSMQSSPNRNPAQLGIGETINWFYVLVSCREVFGSIYTNEKGTA